MELKYRRTYGAMAQAHGHILHCNFTLPTSGICYVYVCYVYVYHFQYTHILS